MGDARSRSASNRRGRQVAALSGVPCKQNKQNQHVRNNVSEGKHAFRMLQIQICLQPRRPEFSSAVRHCPAEMPINTSDILATCEMSSPILLSDTATSRWRRCPACSGGAQRVFIHEESIQKNTASRIDAGALLNSINNR